MSTLEIELDDELLARVDEWAARLGKPRGEVIAEAIRREVEGGHLTQILHSTRTEPLPSEDEAMDLAIAELEAARAERASTDSA